MYSVIRANGEIYNPRRSHYTKGRPPKYPIEHLEVGDHFVASREDLPSLKTLMSQARKFGRDHRLGPGHDLSTYTITRTK